MLFKLDGGIEHVLIDEAQDTAPEQWDIVRALTEEFFSGAGPSAPRRPARPRTVFAVGDEKQSIYSFQGARPERLLRGRGRYRPLVDGGRCAVPGVTLATSFRSTEEVLAFVDAAVRRGPSAPAPWSATGRRHPPPHRLRGASAAASTCGRCSRTAAEDRDAWNDPVDQEPPAAARKTPGPRTWPARSGVRSTSGDRGSRLATSRDHRARPRYGDFLVLVRRRDATFEEIIRALKRRACPSPAPTG